MVDISSSCGWGEIYNCFRRSIDIEDIFLFEICLPEQIDDLIEDNHVISKTE